MKNTFSVFALGLLLSLAAPAHAIDVDTSTLTGSTKLACEALLCLSSGTRPSECAPSLSEYFGITRKKWSDTLNARKAFLNLCPAASEVGMPSLVDAISEGAGRCDAASLNRRTIPVFRLFDVYKKSWGGWRQGRTSYPVCTSRDLEGRRYRRNWSDDDDYQYCQEKRTIIDNSMPDYCRVYINHDFTDLGLRFDGNQYEGGKWVD